MATRIAPKTPPRRPLIASPFALRVLATTVALSTFTGMSAFAATHLLNAAAPLQPGAAATTLAGGGDEDERPAPTIAPTRRTTLGSGITTTTTPARTRTRSS